MFFTRPDFKHPLISALGESGEQAYRAFQVIGRSPWFLVTLRLQDSNTSIRHTICCALDVDLLDLLQNPQSQSIAGIQVLSLSPASADDPSWQLRNAVRIWRSVYPTGYRSLTFEDEHGSEFGYDTVFTEIPKETARDLIYCRI